jgi:phosphohistidine phosphatase SixA
MKSTFKSHFKSHFKSNLKFLLFCIIAFSSVLGASAQIPELSSLDFLKQGGYVIIFRHSTAPFGSYPNGSTDQVSGTVESQWWKSCDFNSARQLDIVGRTEAANLGRAFKRVGIPVSNIVASEFCRCYETAVLMNTGLNIVISTSLTFTLYTNEQRLPELTTRINTVPPASTNTVLVTHGHTVGEYPFDNLQWSDAIIYRPKVGAKAELIGYARVALWVRAATSSLPSGSNVNADKITLSTSPSPQGDKILVQASRNCTVSVLNALGQEILGDVPVKGAQLLDTKGWAKGVYTLVASNGMERSSHTFVKP